MEDLRRLKVILTDDYTVAERPIRCLGRRVSRGRLRKSYGDNADMAKKAEIAASPRAPREDGRKQFLTFMRTDLIRDVKKAALDQDQNALVEDAVEKYLKTKKADKSA